MSRCTKLFGWKGVFEIRVNENPHKPVFSSTFFNQKVSDYLLIDASYFTLEELQTCLVNLSEKGASGPDNMPTISWKNFKFCTKLLYCCNETLEANKPSKHLEPILSRNRNDVYRVRSNLPQRLVLKRIIEKSNIGNRQASIIFFDFSKVFDSVNRYAIFHT